MGFEFGFSGLSLFYFILFFRISHFVLFVRALRVIGKGRCAPRWQKLCLPLTFACGPANQRPGGATRSGVELGFDRVSGPGPIRDP